MPGDPLDPAARAGAVVSREHQQRILAAIAQGQKDGARLVTGGAAVREETGGAFVAPTILDDVCPSSALAQQEIFGPVLSVIGFDGLDEAVEIANGTIYGLGASIWSADLAAAHKVARRFKAGIVYVNCFDADDITTPFGGMKQSGFGRDKSSTRWKNIQTSRRCGPACKLIPTNRKRATRLSGPRACFPDCRGGCAGAAAQSLGAVSSKEGQRAAKRVCHATRPGWPSRHLPSNRKSKKPSAQASEMSATLICSCSGRGCASR